MKKDLDAKIIEAAFALAAKNGWSNTTLSHIAAEAEVPMADVYLSMPTKSAILAAYGQQIDLKMLEASDDVDEDDPARDRLFDVIMNRFDAMADDRDALRVISQDVRYRPFELLALRDSMLQSLRWILEAAGLDAGGARGAVRQRGLALIYADVFATWLKDDDPGLAKTMALLDRRLRRVEDLIRRLQSSRDRFTRPAGGRDTEDDIRTVH